VTPAEQLQGSAAVAQVITAAIAVYYTALTAFATKRAGRDSVFLESTVGSLMSVVTSARKVRASYRSMFGKFASAKAKSEALGAWLRQREEVSDILAELCELLPEIAPAHEAWKVVEKQEDTHATSDSLKLPKPAEINSAHERYDVEHRKFIKCVGEIMRSLR
jgi:hypothetical protein